MTAPVLARPAAPERRPATGPAGVSPRTVVAATLWALLAGALLNSDDLVRRAERLPFGTQRNVALDVATRIDDLSELLWLDRPRAAVDALTGNEHEARPPAPQLPTASPGATPTAGPSASPSPSGTPAVVTPRRPTKADPLRVYLGGDSVAAAFAQSFARLATETGVVSAKTEYRYSTGLTRADYFDWPKRLRERLAADPAPEVVVVLFGANDVQNMMTPSGPKAFGDPAWLAEYRARVGATMDLLVAGGTDVYWVGQPLMRDATFSGRIEVLDEIYAAEAAKRKGVTFVDTRPLLADASGKYAAYLPGASGRPVLVRTSDGVHLTRAGADRVANEVLRRIGRHWPLG